MYNKTNAQPYQQKKKRKACVYQFPATPLSIDFVKLVIFVFLFYFRLWSSPLP